MHSNTLFLHGLFIEQDEVAVVGAELRVFLTALNN